MSRSPLRAEIVVWGLLTLAVVTGCGDGGEPFGVVRGRVLFEGQAVPDAVVLFEPTGAGPAVTTEADREGKFEPRRSASVAGLPPGEYRVAVTPPMYYPGLGPIGEQTGPPPRPDIPPRYREPGSSGLTLVVEEGATVEWDIEMIR